MALPYLQCLVHIWSMKLIIGFILVVILNGSSASKEGRVEAITVLDGQLCFKGSWIYKGFKYRSCSVIMSDDGLSKCPIRVSSDGVATEVFPCFMLGRCQKTSNPNKHCHSFTYKDIVYPVGFCTFHDSFHNLPWCATKPGLSEIDDFSGPPGGRNWDYCRCIPGEKSVIPTVPPELEKDPICASPNRTFRTNVFKQPYATLTIPRLTHEACDRACTRMGYILKALFNGNTCYCGNELDAPRRQPNGLCNVKCAGDVEQLCGGTSTGVVLLTFVEDLSVPPPLPPGFLPEPVCYQPNLIATKSVFKLPFERVRVRRLTHQSCYKICKKLKFLYMGLNGGTLCLCGNELDSPIEADAEEDCDVRCKGDPDQICGGRGLIGAVYVFDIESKVIG